MKRKTIDRIRAARRTGALLLLALVLPATAAALMPRGGSTPVGPNTGALASDAELPDYCLAPNADVLTAKCPPGIDASQIQAMSGSSVPEAAATAGQQQQRQAEEVEDAARLPGMTGSAGDARRREGEARIAQLVQMEIDATQRLLRTTPDSDASKPDIYFRLAQLFYEMQDSYTFKAGEKDMLCLDLESRGEDNAAQACYQERDRIAAQAVEWSDKAIEAYYHIVMDFPDYSRGDEALFFLAFAFEERARGSDDPDVKDEMNRNARTVYNELITNHQDSPFVANAYLSFAEFYFNEEGNMSEAIAYYDRIINIQPESRVKGYSLYKRSWCLYNLQEYTECLASFEAVIKYAQDNPDNADSPELLRTARMELPQAYAQTGRADQAWRYFERVGGDLVVRMMESLAVYYYSQGEHDNAVTAYHELMDKNRDSDKLCDYQYWITQSRMAQATTSAGGSTTVAVSGTAKDLIVQEITNMVDIWKLFVVQNGSRHSADSVTVCTWYSADFCIDTAVRWHREAAGSEQMPGTNDETTMAKAADLYKLFLDNFGQRTGALAPYFYDTLQPPPEWEYQNPYSVYKAHYFAAELLWKAKKWELCGQAFTAVVEADPIGEYAAEAAYASVLCYKQQYDTEFADRDRVLRSDSGPAGQRTRDRDQPREGQSTSWGSSIPAPTEFTASQAAMEAAFHRYVCYVNEHEDLANVKFNRAFIYLDANKWQEAAVLFKQIAEQYKTSQDQDDRRIAVLSSMNYFEIIVRLSRAGVTACTPEVIAATNGSLEGHFPSVDDGGFLENADERRNLDLFLEAVPVLHCQQMLLKVKEMADQGKWEQAAELALKIHDEFPNDYPGYRCLDSSQQDMMPGILNEAARYFQNANKIRKAIDLRIRLVQEHPDCEFVNDAQYSVAQSWAQLAFFEKAAEAYETFARDHAAGRQADDRAPEAMLYAVDIRIGLGQDVQAKADADFLDSKFGSNRKYQKLAAEAYFKVGELYTSTRDWNEVIRHYEDYLQKYGRKGGKEFEVRATMLVAQAHWSLVNCTWDDDEDRTRQTRCRQHKSSAFDFATRANGLVDLPEYSAEPAEGEPTDPSELRRSRRERTWNTLLEELAIEVEAAGDAAQVQIAVRAIKVAEALGQARFYIGEKLYDQFVAIAWQGFDPEDWDYRGRDCDQFRGAGEYMRICISTQKYKLWTEKAYNPFVQKRNDKIGEASAYYTSIAYLDVPAWEIAASSRVGDMYLQFWKDLYNAPLPPAFNREEFMDAAQEYQEQLDVGSATYKDHAIEAYGYCLATATREQWFNQYSNRCEEALYEIDPSRYRVSNEVYARPSLNRNHFAPPDLDLAIIESADEFGEISLPEGVTPVPGAPAIDDQMRYRFFLAPPPPPPAPATPPAAAEED